MAWCGWDRIDRKSAGPLLLAVAFCVAVMGMYVGSIPRYYTALVETCLVRGCGDIVPAMTFPAAGQGFALESYALLFVAIDCSFTFAFYASGAILLWKGARQPMSLLAAVAMVSFGTSFPSLAAVASQASPFAEQSFMLIAMLGWITLSLFFFLFPDGYFVPRWTLYVFFLIVAVDVVQFLNRGRTWELLHVSEVVQLLWYVGSTGILIYSQVHRFRNVSPPVERQRTKWVVYGVSIGVVGFLVMSILFDPALHDGSATAYLYLNAILNASLTAIPITLTIAVLRRRLWNIDPLVNRTLVYAALTVCVVVLYTVVVIYLGRLFHAKDNFVVSLLSTAVVAALFAPLKEWLQRRIHRFMKGRHDDPYAVLLELGDQLIRPLPPEAMLDAIVRTVKEALRVPYAGLSIGVGDGGQERFVASAGESADCERYAYPVLHRGERLGTLYIAERSPGERFDAEDRKFLDVLLRQAGPIVENVNMTLGMKLLAKDLQLSREKLVLAREEERRRIRNNLHDDLAPKLAALALNAATARKYVEKQPAVAIDMLEDLRQVIRSTVGEIRTMVHDLRPPALDELGLIGAIGERVHELSKPALLLAEEEGAEPLRIEVRAPEALPALPAAVEVAAYRIVVESVVNVVKHTRATACTVRLEVRDDGRLTVEIEDDGIASGAVAGTADPAYSAGKGGIGRQSIRERTAELGGQCAIERSAQGGTLVRAVLPFEDGRGA